MKEYIGTITFRWWNDKKSIAFREWLEGCGTSEQLPKDTFKESGTMVATRLVIIDK